MDIREERTSYFARLVAFDPEVALEILQVGYFHVTGDQVVEMGGEAFSRGAIFFRESVPVDGEGGRIPLRGKDVGQGLDGVRILTEGLVVGSSERKKWVALRGKRWRMQGMERHDL